MMTVKTDITRFNVAMKNLAAHVGMSTGKFLRVEGKMLSQELAKAFTPKLRKSEKGIVMDRRQAFRIGKNGLAQIPVARLQRVINRQRATGKRPTVRAAIAQPAQRKAIANLGTLAAGFLGKGNKLGATAKGFVKARLSKCFGDVTIRMGILSRSIRLRNWSPWLANMRNAERQTRMVIRKRTSAMRTTLNRLAKGLPTYWKGQR